MALKAAHVTVNGAQATVTLESDLKDFSAAISELQHANARHTATAEAAKHGLGNAAVNGFTLSPYPVTAEGADAVGDLAGKTACYRVDIPVISRML